MEFNLADLFESIADAIPERKALVCGDHQLTFGELDARATRLANAWAAQGIGAGDHIGLYLYNRAEYVECMVAAFKLRAVTINCNYRYVAEELRYVFDNADLVAVVYEPELADIVAQARTPAIRVALEVGPAYDAFLASGSDVREFPERSGDDLFIIYTGGTTGMPRGVMWKHKDLFYAALQGGNPGGEPMERAEDLAPQCKRNGAGINIHPAAPLIHGASMLASWICLLNGGHVAFVPGRSFDPVATAEIVAAHDIHSINLVGDAMALPLVDTLKANPGRWDFAQLSVLSSAGAVLSGSVREALEELLPMAMIMNNFGASETGHQGTAFYEDGKPVWFMDDRHTTVLDDNLDRLEPGSDTIGRMARFGHIPVGYYGDPEKTAKTFFEKDGIRYVLPGDMASIAEDGSIVFLGRGAVCINSGGEKVFAEEVEEALKGHPSVFDAVVVGVPDDRWGQRVEALVTARVDDPDLADIETFCRTQVAGYKTPRKIWVVTDLNRQPSGKPDYRWAKAKAIELGA